MKQGDHQVIRAHTDAGEYMNRPAQGRRLIKEANKIDMNKTKYINTLY